MLAARSAHSGYGEDHASERYTFYDQATFILAGSIVRSSLVECRGPSLATVSQPDSSVHIEGARGNQPTRPETRCGV